MVAGVNFCSGGGDFCERGVINSLAVCQEPDRAGTHREHFQLVRAGELCHQAGR